MERRSKLLGLDAQIRVQDGHDVLASPQYLKVKALIVSVLDAYPDARHAVSRALLNMSEMSDREMGHS